MTHNMIESDSATGEEVYEVVAKIEPNLVGVSRKLAIIACIAIAVTAMNPDMTEDEVQEGVKGCSEWIALYASGIGLKLTKEHLN